MNILCVIDSLGSGGAQRQLVELATGFKEKGHDVSLLVYHDINFFKELLDKVSIPVNVIIESNYLLRLIKMRKFIRSGNYNAVLSFLDASNFICEVSSLPWRKSNLVVGERSANPNILKSFKLRSFRWFHLLANYIVSNSNKNIQLIKKINPILNESKYKVIYNIIDFEKWKPNPNYEFKKGGKLNIVVVASHQYLKNLNGLVDAVSLLSEEERSLLRIDWYGDRRDNSLMVGQKKIKEYHLNNVFNFYPATHQISNIIEQSDVVGLFSYYEGLPNVICEAMACGKPVIVSAVGDLPKHIRDKAFFVDPKDAISIATAIRNVMNISKDMLKTYGMKNYEYAFQNFDKKKIVCSYLELFER